MKTFLLSLLLGGFLVTAEAHGTSLSVYDLTAQLIDQSGTERGLDMHRGHPLLVTMFYASCPMACPLLIDSVRAAERTLPPEQRANLRVLLISIDPEKDTPATLRKLAQERRIDLTRWTLAQADERTVRKIAAVLGIQYRKLPNGEYNHSSVVTLLSANGEIVVQGNGSGKPDEALTAALVSQTSGPSPASRP